MTLREIQVECLKLECKLVAKVIVQAKGDMARLAELLDCSRPYLYVKLARMHLGPYLNAIRTKNGLKPLAKL